MAFGEVARTAMEKAIEAYKAVVEVRAKLDGLVHSFGKLEEREERQMDALERRLNDRVRVVEDRLRQLETEVSSLHAKVDGALAEAMKVVFLEQHVKRQQVAADVAKPKSIDGALT